MDKGSGPTEYRPKKIDGNRSRTKKANLGYQLALGPTPCTLFLGGIGSPYPRLANGGGKTGWHRCCGTCIGTVGEFCVPGKCIPGAEIIHGTGTRKQCIPRPLFKLYDREMGRSFARTIFPFYSATLQ